MTPRPWQSFSRGNLCSGSLRRVKIESGKRVRLKARLSVDGGQLLEDNVVEYVHGAGTMLAGLEKVLEGLEAGAKREGKIAPKEAFGNESLQPQKTLARAEFPKDAKLEAGMTFAAKGANGQDVLLRIVKAEKDTLDVRYLHPLAEKTIAYDVEVLMVMNPPPPLPPGAQKKA